MQMKLDDLTQPDWEDIADNFCDRDKQYGAFSLCIPAVVQPQTEGDAAVSAPPAFGDLMECFDIVLGIWQMRQETSRPGSIPIWLGCSQLQSNLRI